MVPERFSILVSEDLTPCIDQSIIGKGGGGMNKGGGEFSFSDDGAVEYKLSRG
jgi:hypothetical protein